MKIKLENMTMVEDVVTEARQCLDACICTNLYHKYHSYYPTLENIDPAFYRNTIFRGIYTKYRSVMEKINNNKYHDILCDNFQYLFEEDKYLNAIINYCRNADLNPNDLGLCFDDGPRYVYTVKHNPRLMALAKASYERDHRLSIRWERVEEV